MSTVLALCVDTSDRNCEYVRLVVGVECTAGRTSQRMNAASNPTGSSQCRQLGGGGGGLPPVGLSPGGGGVACLLTGISFPFAMRLAAPQLLQHRLPPGNSPLRPS